MDAILIIILIGVITVLLNFKSFYATYRRDKIIDKIPGPRKLPFFGTLFPFVYTPRHERFKVITEWANKHKNLGFYRIWIGSKIPEIRILRCDFAEQIFRSSKHIEKSTTYRLIESWLGKGKRVVFSSSNRFL